MLVFLRTKHDYYAALWNKENVKASVKTTYINVTPTKYRQANRAKAI